VPLIVEALRAVPASSATVDGEGVVCDDERGVTDFDRLRAAVGRGASREAFLFAFDLLELDGHDLRSQPWRERRAALAQLVGKASGGVRFSRAYRKRRRRDRVPACPRDGAGRHPREAARSAYRPAGAPIGSR